MDTKSSVQAQGEYVTQIIHFVNGVKRTFSGLNTTTIKQGQYTKFHTNDGRMILINDENVLCIEVFPE